MLPFFVVQPLPNNYAINFLPYKPLRFSTFSRLFFFMSHEIILLQSHYNV